MAGREVGVILCGGNIDADWMAEVLAGRTPKPRWSPPWKRSSPPSPDVSTLLASSPTVFDPSYVTHPRPVAPVTLLNSRMLSRATSSAASSDPESVSTRRSRQPPMMSPPET
jgi:hypothetical protein